MYYIVYNIGVILPIQNLEHIQQGFPAIKLNWDVSYLY